MKLHLVSLGCAKNLVDSEMMLGRLKEAGWTATLEPENADIIIVNTCSFIEAAVNESIDIILEMVKCKQKGICQRLIVTGCLPERFREEMVDYLPEVDIFLGTGAFDKIKAAVEGYLNESNCLLPDPNVIPLQGQDTPRIRTCVHMAYIKIAEGCSRRCTYCIIPKLRGRQRSRSIDDIAYEARSLINSGVKELILIAQDTTFYGGDLNPPVHLEKLLKKISEISDNVWVRLLYGHPESVDEQIIRTVGIHHNICSYFDIPIQHASNSVLKRMGRNYSQDDLLGLFDTIRSLVPEAALRTTVMTGFPGETDKDVETLSDFIEYVGFDHLGVFIYSDFKDLPSHRFPDHVPIDVAQERYDHLMSCQVQISLNNNRKRLGRIFTAIVEEASGNKLFKSRTFFQAPDVDGITYIDSGQLEIGSFTSVRIKEAFEYDLIGEVA